MTAREKAAAGGGDARPVIGEGSAAAAGVPAAPPAPHPLAFALAAMRGTVLAGDPGVGVFAGAAVDSRAVRKGQLFFALGGARVDGHDFCGLAASAGAAGVVVDQRRGMPPGLPASAGAPASSLVIGVEDPLMALADLARAIRADFGGRVVGITGSNGKTTTKELTAAALSSAGPVLRTEGNFNTEIGLPLTIIGASGREAFWVLEMAMRGRGQIALLADIARPHVGVITNVAGAHVELLGSIEEVARAKGELFAGLDGAGIAVLPGRDPLIEAQAANLPETRKIRFDRGASAATGPGARADGAPAFHLPAAVGTTSPRPVDVRVLEAIPAGLFGQVVRFAVRDQPVVARLPLGGAHNAGNAAAALGVAAALDLPIPAAAAALAQTVLPPHRSAPFRVGGRIILDDCYNANPSSMRAALASVVVAAAGPGTAGAGGRPFAILGDMLELGPDAADLHRAIGREAGRQLSGLATLGALGAQIAGGARDAGLDPARVFAGDDPASVASFVASWSRPGDWILVKASRGMRLERVIDALVEEFRKQPGMT